MLDRECIKDREPSPVLRILTPDGLRVICAGLDNDPEKIGIHMLEILEKFRNEGLFDIVVDDE